MKYLVIDQTWEDVFTTLEAVDDHAAFDKFLDYLREDSDTYDLKNFTDTAEGLLIDYHCCPESLDVTSYDGQFLLKKEIN